MIREDAHKLLDDAIDAKVGSRITFDIPEREEDGIRCQIEHLTVRTLLALAKQISAK